MTKKIISTTTAPAAIGPYSQAVEANELIFVSGQIGLDPGTSALVPGGIAAETRQAIANIEAILTAAGSGLNRVVKATILLADIRDFAQVNDIYKEWFDKEPPARAAFAVAALPLGARIEIEAIALAGNGQ
ncbi:MAG: Rid family detoxifying hydrolase [Myxococcota bacterium]|nr:Rid family detoxifying hydrolase [Myxococcota bacterium]